MQGDCALGYNMRILIALEEEVNLHPYTFTTNIVILPRIKY